MLIFVLRVSTSSASYYRIAKSFTATVTFPLTKMGMRNTVDGVDKEENCFFAVTVLLAFVMYVINVY